MNRRFHNDLVMIFLYVNQDNVAFIRFHRLIH